MCHGMYPPYAVNAAQIGILQNAGVPGYCLYDFGMRAKAVVSNFFQGEYMKLKITRHREDSVHNSCGVGLVLIECLKSLEVESSLPDDDRRPKLQSLLTDT